MSEWQPIETAPKDEIIQVYGQPRDLVINGDVMVRWTEPGVHQAYWDEIDDSFVLDGGSWLGPFIAPPHWKRLQP